MKIVHYLNQFFGGFGGEEAATAPPDEQSGPVGPGLLVHRLLDESDEIVATVTCGDSYFGEQPDEAERRILELIMGHEPDAVVAGPAFDAGRYGAACIAVARACEGRGVVAVTGMHPENPGLIGVERSSVFVVPTGANALDMTRSMEKMVSLLKKRVAGEPIGLPELEGYIPRGLRINYMYKATGAERAIEGLSRKINGADFSTEIPLPSYESVQPSILSRPLAEATLALVTEAGVVPDGNPNGLPSSRATEWFKYPIADLADLRSEDFLTVHGGFDTAAVNEDPDRVLPLDVVRQLENEGFIGKLHDHFYTTTGMAMALEEAERIGKEIAQDLVNEGVHAVLVTST